MNRNEIIQHALTWNGTPYHHHARIKGVGVDCAQMVVGIAVDAGMMTEQQAAAVPNYPIQWNLHSNEELLLTQLRGYGCIEVDREAAQVGDIVTFRFGRATGHVGIIVSETEFIHAARDTGKVVIIPWNDQWKKRWTHTFKFPGIEQ